MRTVYALAGILSLAVLLPSVECKGRFAKRMYKKYGRMSRVLRAPDVERVYNATEMTDKIKGNKPSVIIVGAGAAGVAAIDELVTHDVTDFTVLEGSDMIGGRVQSINLPADLIATYPALKDVYLEAGANWLQGIGGDKENPIIPLIEAAGLKLTRTDWDDYTVLGANGADLTEEYDEAWDRWEAANEAAIELGNKKWAEEAASMNGTVPDMSMRAAWRKFGWEAKTGAERALEYGEWDFEYASQPGLGSVAYRARWSSDEFGHDDDFVSDSRGFVEIFRHHMENLLANGTADERIKYNKVVTEVDTSGNKAVVTCKDGSTYTADYVIMSPNLNVLQQQRIAFKPALPEYKKEQLQNYRVEYYTKVVAIYDPAITPFWAETTMQLTTDPRWPVFLNVQTLTGDAAFRTALTSHVTGEGAEQLSYLTDAEAQAEWVASTRRIWGSSAPEPIYFHRSTWVSDPLQGAMYSNWPFGMSQSDFDVMKGPEGPLYFSGEWASKKYSGFVHGAWHQGKETVRDLVTCAADKMEGRACWQARDALLTNKTPKQNLENCHGVEGRLVLKVQIGEQGTGAAQACNAAAAVAREVGKADDIVVLDWVLRGADGVVDCGAAQGRMADATQNTAGYTMDAPVLTKLSEDAFNQKLADMKGALEEAAGVPVSAVSVVVTPAPVTSAPAPPVTPTPKAASVSDDDMSSTAVALIIVLAVLGFILLVGVAYLLGTRSSGNAARLAENEPVSNA